MILWNLQKRLFKPLMKGICLYNQSATKKAYEECARDKLADRTTTCRKVRCQSLTDRMQKQIRKQSCRDDGIAFSRSLFVGNRGGIVNEK